MKFYYLWTYTLIWCTQIFTDMLTTIYTESLVRFMLLILQFVHNFDRNQIWISSLKITCSLLNIQITNRFYWRLQQQSFNNEEISYFLTPPGDTDISTLSTQLFYVPETRPLSSRTNTQLRDSHLSPLEATTSQVAVCSADSMPLLGYPGPLFKTRPAHNIQSPRQ